MTILMSDLTVEVYNADYRVLSRIRWQAAVRLILRGAVYVIDMHSPSVRIHSPSLVIELPVSVALREYVHIPSKGRIGSPARGCFAATGTSVSTARARRHRGPRSATVPWWRRHVVQPGRGMPAL